MRTQGIPEPEPTLGFKTQRRWRGLEEWRIRRFAQIESRLGDAGYFVTKGLPGVVTALGTYRSGYAHGACA